MNRKAYRILAVFIIAAILTATLTGCGEKSKIEKDPEGYLTAALDATVADVSAGYAGSPASALSSAINSSSTAAEFDLSTADEATGKIGVSGTLYSDTDANKYFLDGAVFTAGIELVAKMTIDPEFIGVSFPFLLGSDTFYGLRPYNIAQQAEGSIFDINVNPEIGIDISEFQSFDDMVSASLKSDKDSFEESAERIEEASQSLFSGNEYTVSKLKETDKDTFLLATTLSNDALVKYAEDIADIVFDSEMFSYAVELAAINDDSITEDSLKAAADAAINDFKVSAAEANIGYYISEGKVTEISIAVKTEETDLFNSHVNFCSDGSSIKVTADSEDAEFTFTSSIDNTNGYVHTVAISADDETVTLSTGWSEEGALTVSASNGEENVILTGILEVTEGEGFSFENGILSIPETENNPAADIKISLKAEDGADVPEAEHMANIFELSENDILGIIMNVYSMIYGEI